MKRYISLLEDTYNIKDKYNLFNKLYFENKLPNIEIKQVNKNSRFIGQVISSRENVILHMEINSKNFDGLSDKNKDAVLVHEMIHVYVNRKGDDPDNLHRGKFLIKAKELEKKTGLKIIGRFYRDSDDLELKYKDVDKIDVYAVIKTYTKNFLKKNAQSIDFYSTLDKAEEIGRNLAMNNYFSHIYKIQTNTPLIGYDQIKKNIDTSRGWVVYKPIFIKNIMDGIKKYSNYAEYIKTI